MALPLVQLIQDMKREDPGRSAPYIIRELELAGLLAEGTVSESTVQRILRKASLSGPQLEVTTPARYRWVAAHANEVWQGDALHGPKLIDPTTGRKRKTIIFGLLFATTLTLGVVPVLYSLFFGVSFKDYEYVPLSAEKPAGGE